MVHINLRQTKPLIDLFDFWYFEDYYWEIMYENKGFTELRYNDDAIHTR